MALDPYSSCPAGTGKKLKFCCSDLLAELQKIDRMIEGEQFRAATEHIASIEPRYGQRACLLATRSMLELRLRQLDRAKQTAGQFLTAFPDNPVAFAQSALVTAFSEGGHPAMVLLQGAIERSPDPVPSTLIDVMASIAEVLAAEGKLLAARALAWEVLSYDERRERTASLVQRIGMSKEVPLPLKEDFTLSEPPRDASFSKDAQVANELAQRGHWLAATEKYQALAERYADAPAVWRNLAILRTWLADDERAVRTWRRYAALDVPFDDAVEAESLANYLEGEPATAIVSQLRITYAIRDSERLFAVLATDKRLTAMPMPEREPDDQNEPPPKAIYALAARPRPERAEGLKHDDMAWIVGQVFVYGKQTDREARLELYTYSDDQREQSQTVLAEVAGDALGAAESEEVVASVAVEELVLSARWLPPLQTAGNELQQLARDVRRERLLNVWPARPQPRLDRKTPAEVAADPAYRVRLSALILSLESLLEANRVDFDIAALRTKLGLPAAEPISAEGLDIDQLPLVRFARVEAEKLNDDQLSRLQFRAASSGATRALKRTTEELLNRPTLITDNDKPQLYRLMVSLAATTDEALTWLAEGRKASAGVKQSCAPWDIDELEIRLVRQETDQFSQIFDHIHREHWGEPGVQDEVLRLFMSAGLVGPDGRLRVPVAPSDAPLAGQPPAAAEEPKIWTPESERAAAGKSSLWIPGSE